MPDTARATAEPRIDRAPMPGARERPWARTRAALRDDRAHWRRRGWPRARFARGYHAVWLYRLSRYAHERGWRVTAWLLWLVNGWWTGADIPPSSRIAGGLFLPYPYGAVIAGAVGRDAAFGVQASIGGLLKEPDSDVGGGPGLPVLGDGVVLEAGALVLGAVRVGDGARLGPRVVVLKDVARAETVMPQPWRALPGRGGAA
ncbi:serine acetyltransferase [Methylobacterium sp. NEAU 140]|uniref:serine acetyltransferase n=1 Tax=Methylobacterium sp. NEAU 140 TaxID=3064945 RepID=UPI002732ED58|nr:serine acetyltransferase [Methylobacterium sp. NEAU 140]MDP4021773.1 serine acetyltransferase [Methylobacterium sp. NEAU 140]